MSEELEELEEELEQEEPEQEEPEQEEPEEEEPEEEEPEEEEPEEEEPEEEPEEEEPEEEEEEEPEEEEPEEEEEEEPGLLLSGGLNPLKNAEDLNASHVVLTDQEKQNLFGRRRVDVADVGDGFLSVVAVKTPQKFTPEQWTSLFMHMIENYGVITMQALFEAELDAVSEDQQNNLAIVAHLTQSTKVAY